jgi:ankyrin repeat protein
MKRIVMFIICCSSVIVYSHTIVTQELFNYLTRVSENGTVDVKQACDDIALLIKKGAQINARNEGNLTPLMIAARGKVKQGEDILEFLIMHGADMNARDHYKDAALNFALHTYNSDYAKKLIQLGATITSKMMFDAVCIPELLELLIPYCAHLQERNYSGDSLLHVVASYNYQLTTQLIDKIDPFIRNTRDGRSVLHSVFIDGYLLNEIDESRISQKKLVIAYLLKKGLMINSEDNYGQTPLHVLIQESMENHIKKELIEFVIARGANALKKDHNGFSPLHYALHANQTEVINALIHAIQEHQPARIKEARAELIEDLERIQQTTEKRNQWRAIGSYVFNACLNGFFLFGLYRAWAFYRKRKIH